MNCRHIVNLLLLVHLGGRTQAHRWHPSELDLPEYVEGTPVTTEPTASYVAKKSPQTPKRVRPFSERRQTTLTDGLGKGTRRKRVIWEEKAWDLPYHTKESEKEAVHQERAVYDTTREWKMNTRVDVPLTSERKLAASSADVGGSTAAWSPEPEWEVTRELDELIKILSVLFEAPLPTVDKENCSRTSCVGNTDSVKNRENIRVPSLTVANSTNTVSKYTHINVMTNSSFAKNTTAASSISVFQFPENDTKPYLYDDGRKSPVEFNGMRGGHFDESKLNTSRKPNALSIGTSQPTIVPRQANATNSLTRIIYTPNDHETTSAYNRTVPLATSVSGTNETNDAFSAGSTDKHGTRKTLNSVLGQLATGNSNTVQSTLADTPRLISANNRSTSLGSDNRQTKGSHASSSHQALAESVISDMRTDRLKTPVRDVNSDTTYQSQTSTRPTALESNGESTAGEAVRDSQLRSYLSESNTNVGVKTNPASYHKRTPSRVTGPSVVHYDISTAPVVEVEAVTVSATDSSSRRVTSSGADSPDVSLDSNPDVSLSNSPDVSVSNNPDVSLNINPDVSVSNNPDVSLSNSSASHTYHRVRVSPVGNISLAKVIVITEANDTYLTRILTRARNTKLTGINEHILTQARDTNMTVANGRRVLTNVTNASKIVVIKASDTNVTSVNEKDISTVTNTTVSSLVNDKLNLTYQHTDLNTHSPAVNISRATLASSRSNNATSLVKEKEPAASPGRGQYLPDYTSVASRDTSSISDVRRSNSSVSEVRRHGNGRFSNNSSSGELKLLSSSQTTETNMDAQFIVKSTRTANASRSMDVQSAPVVTSATPTHTANVGESHNDISDIHTRHPKIPPWIHKGPRIAERIIKNTFRKVKGDKKLKRKLLAALVKEMEQHLVKLLGGSNPVLQLHHYLPTNLREMIRRVYHSTTPWPPQHVPHH